MSLIYKYSPSSLDEHDFNLGVIGALKHLSACDALNVMLVGNECVGKTAIANNLIRHYYEGYTPDVLTINSLYDSATYRTTLRMFCKVRSITPSKKRTVFIENYDIIQEQYQYMLRSLIDGFSHSVNFVCIAMNLNKVIDSVQSRLTVFNVLQPEADVMMRIVARVIAREKIRIGKDAVAFLLEVSDFNINRLLNYLQKCVFVNENITLKRMIAICDGIRADRLQCFTRHCASGRTRQAIDAIVAIYRQGNSILDILDEYLTYIKHSDAVCETARYRIMACICKYTQSYYDNNENKLELVFFADEIVRCIAPNVKKET